MREISTDVTVAMGSNPSLSSGPKGAQPLGNQGNRAPENTPNSHVTHTAAVPGDALPGPKIALPDDCEGGGHVHRTWGPGKACACGRFEQLSGPAIPAATDDRHVTDGLHDDYGHARFAIGAVELTGTHPAAPPEETQPSESDASPVGAADPRRPAPRYCTETWEESGDRAVCRAVLTDGLNCTVCEGLRCYAHCGSVDHFTDATLYTAVPVGLTRLIRVVRTPGGLSCGHLAVRQSDDKWHVLVRESSLDPERVFDRLMALAQSRPESLRDGEGSDGDPGDGEPDAELPAGEMFHRIDMEELGLYERHVPMLDAIVRDSLEALRDLPADVVECLGAIAYAKTGPTLVVDMLCRLLRAPGVERARVRRTIHGLALDVVKGAFNCGCDDCEPVRRGFAHLIGEGGKVGVH
jgi:hypothetical protein